MRRFHELPVLQWQNIEKIAGSDVSRIIGIVPIIGYLIVFNDGIASILSFNGLAGVESNSASPFYLEGVTRLRFTFFGSIFVFLSFIIFSIWSPKILKNSKNDFDFAERVVSQYSLAEIREIEAAVHDENWIRQNLYIAEMRASLAGVTFPNGPRASGYQFKTYIRNGEIFEYIRHISREWWVVKMHSYKFARTTCISFGVIGYVLLSIPLLDIFQAVVLDISADLLT